MALVTSSALQPERWAGRGPDRARMRAQAGHQVLATWNMLGKASSVTKECLINRCAVKTQKWNSCCPIYVLGYERLDCKNSG